MKPRDAATLAARISVGAVLVYAGASKTSAPVEEFALVIQSYGLVSAGAALPLAGVLPWLELLVGWALILGVQTRAAAAAATTMFALFLASLGLVLARGIALPNCGCFGEALHFTTKQAFLFDSLMAAFCAAAFRGGAGPWSLDRWSSRR